MTNTKLNFNLPAGFVQILNRYKYGNQNRTNDERAKGWFLMQKLFDEYNKWNDKLNNLLNVEWDEQNIEGHFGDKIFNNAHRRLRNYRERTQNTHKVMFYLLTGFDKIQTTFVQGQVISPKEIYEEFKEKYVDKLNSQTSSNKN